ncbi:MAG: hypothetical protein ABH886_01885 [Candidatus Desantisbacteria bacterium]
MWIERFQAKNAKSQNIQRKIGNRLGGFLGVKPVGVHSLGFYNERLLAEFQHD